jgi:hypothetical protein
MGVTTITHVARTAADDRHAEQIVALYVSGFQPGDLEAFGVGLVAAFVATGLRELTAAELAAGTAQVRADGWPEDAGRLAACHVAVAALVEAVA